MRVGAAGSRLEPVDLPLPTLGAGQVRIAVSACAVCRTDLHIVDGELSGVRWPIVPGHEVVGRVSAVGHDVSGLSVGARVGVPWLGWACGVCDACRRGAENLCPQARFTGCDLDGGFADTVTADARFVFSIPDGYDDEQAAPLLCAGLIGWRSLQAAGPPAAAQRVGIYGFGAAAHLVTQVAAARGQRIYAFVRPGDAPAMAFARESGAVWAGDSTASPPLPLDAAVVFAPVGDLVPLALRAVRPGGTVVCGGIHMSDIPTFPYALLWGERCLRSVANLTRRDAREFLAFVSAHPLRVRTRRYPLAQANEALADLRAGSLSGAAVLIP